MIACRSLFRVVALSLSAMILSCAAAIAQESGSEEASPAPSPAPQTTPTDQVRPTIIDQEYDGKTHLSLTPYVWLPSVNGTFSYRTPTLAHHGIGAGTEVLNVNVGPNAYLSKINFAAMGAFELRKGNVDAFGDFINLNGSSGATQVVTLSGPLGKLHVPIDVGSSGHISSTIWELAAGVTLAHSHNASVEFFSGWRQASVKGELDWNLSLPKHPEIARMGSVTSGDTLSDVIFGFRGKLALGDSGWFIPYYADIGAGGNNSSWQAYGGVGRAFRSGSVLLLFRNLSYSLPGGSSFVQSLRFGGPLVGYTFKL